MVAGSPGSSLIAANRYQRQLQARIDALVDENERLREALSTEIRRAAHFRHKLIVGPDSKCSPDCPEALLDGTPEPTT